MVLVVVGPFAPVADKGDRGAGEVEGKALRVEDRFDGVGVGYLLVADDPVDQRGHRNRGVPKKGPDHFIHLDGLEEGLVPLDVDDDVVILELQGNRRPRRSGRSLTGGERRS